MSTEEENVSEKLNDNKISTIKASINNIWRPEFKKPLYDLVETTNKLVCHTYLFSKLIFIKEFETDDAFDMDSYVDQGFFVEVFLALIDRKVRDGSKTGKTRLTSKVVTFRSLIGKYKEEYFDIAQYKPPKVVNAKQIALYECMKIQTTYINNLKAHFGNRLRMLLNYLCDKKEESSRVRKQLEKERYSEASIKDLIRKTIIQPCTNVILEVSMKQVPTDNFLAIEKKNKIQQLLSMYPNDYTFQKSSIFYDVKANPTKHFKAWHKLTQICQEYGLPSYHCYPLRYSFIPAYMNLDATIVNNHILKNSALKEDKYTIWGIVCYIQKKAMKPQGSSKSLRFEGTMQTDSISVSIIKQNVSTNRKARSQNHVGTSKKKSKSDIDQEEKVEYVEDLPRKELIAMQGKCVLIDPNRRDLLYCMKETSTVERKEIFRFTSSYRNKQSRLFKRLRKKTKPESVRLAETFLSSKTKSFAVDRDSFENYIKSRAIYENLLYMYYGNETNSVDVTLYYEHLSNDFQGYFPTNANTQDGLSQLQQFIAHLQVMLDQRHIIKRVPIAAKNCLLSAVSEVIEWCSTLHQENEAYTKKLEELKALANLSFKELQLLPFRKMRLSSKICYLQKDEKLVKNLRSKFGSNAVLILGDWSAPNAKYHEPIRNKGLVKLLKRSGFSLFKINEYKTSSTCPYCQTTLKKFKIIKNPRPYQRERMPTVLCNELLKCTNHPSERLFNRDMAAVLNFRKILFELRRTGERSECFRRSTTGKRKQDSIDSKKNTKKTKFSA